jgi:hypothetical protein
MIFQALERADWGACEHLLDENGTSNKCRINAYIYLMTIIRS